jgi:uncharacterized iron-regulated membrane protein
MAEARRPLWFTIHSWLGAKLFLVLFVILSTGTLATVSNEIDWLLNPQMRAAPTAAPVSWQAVHDAVRAARPDNEIGSLSAPVEPHFAIEVLTTNANGAFERVYVNPATATVQGSHGWITVQRFLRNLHMGLFLPEYGILVVGFFGFLLLGSLVSGLVVYKKFWRGFWRAPRLGNPRRLMGDLHRLFGLWSLWFILFIGVTGAWYFIEDAIDYAWERDAPEAAAPTPRQARQDWVSVAEVEAIVRREWPTFRIDYINLPARADAPITVGGHAEALLVRSRANLIYIHPITGAVLRIKRGTEVPLTERWVDTADELHFGTFGGLATKLVWFLFGAMLSFLSFSGFWLLMQRARGRAPRAAPARRTKLPPQAQPAT